MRSPLNFLLLVPIAILVAAASPGPAVKAGGQTEGGREAGGPLRVGDKLPPPPGFVPASQCVAREGVHYLAEGGWPVPPALVYDEQGRLVSIQYIIAQRDLKERMSWNRLPGVAGRPVDHVDIHFSPGTDGAGIPHYSVHLYFISVEAQQRICPQSTAREPVRRATR